jgi:uncharacterized protein
MPAGAATSVPCIVLGHGFTGTQDRLQSSAERFASEGMAALTFDYRNFGESSGEPRQVIRIKDQLEDFRNAIAFARSQPGINPDKIGIWGSSLGGGHVISIAGTDPRIAAVVSQVPFNGFPKKVEGRSKEATNRLLGAMIKDALRGMFGRKPLYIKAVGNTGELAVMASPQAQKTIDAMQSEQWQNRVAPRVLLEMMRYKPGKVAANIKVPVLVCIGALDKETLGEVTRPLAAGPKAELREYPIAHFDFYRPDMRDKILGDQATFFKEALKS